MSDVTLVNHRGEKTKTFDSRAAATENRDDMIGLGASPEDFEVVKGAIDDYSEYADGLDTVGNQSASEAKSDGGTEVVETPDTDPRDDADVVETQPTADDLPDDPSVGEDPVDWLPSHFIDTIQGVPAVNRKGYAVIASKYGVSVEAEPVTLPSETDFEYAEFRAVATTEDGQTYSGFGSAHVERQDGDDKHLLAELAETRAMKRATAWATGVGMTAVSELQNDL